MATKPKAPAKPASKGEPKEAGKALPKKVEIYALSDPRTGEIRYIGKANDSAARLKDHLREKRLRTPLYAWIAKLRREGVTPAMDVQCICDTEVWQEHERAVIAQGRADGLRLLNVADGGDEPHCPTEVRAENARKLNERMKADPFMARIRNIKRAVGAAIRRGDMKEENKAKLRLAAQKRPDLFGEYANL